MPTRLSRPVLILGALAVAATPGAAAAQFATVEARAGVVPTAGEYADALGTGQTLGVGASMRVTPTLSVRLDADAGSGFLDDAAGDLSIYTYMLGLETQLLPTRGLRRAPLQLSATLSGGATQTRYRPPAAGTAGAAGARQNDLHPAVAVGLRLTAELSRTLGIFGGATATATLLGDEDGGAASAARTPLAGGGTLVTVPIVAGVRFRF